MGRKPRLDPAQARDAAEAYLAGEPVTSIANRYKVDFKTIYNFLERQGIARNPPYHQLTLAQITEIKRRYQAGETSYRLAIDFGVSRPAICKHLRDANLTPLRDEFGCVYTCDHQFFSNVAAPNKAYILGLIAADGCIRQPNQLRINLKAEDVDLLRDVARAMSSKASIHLIQRSGLEKGRFRADFSITSPQIVSDLAGFGIVPRKTFTVGWPNLPEFLYRHFVRGVFDGDGCFALDSAKQPQFIITGNEHLPAGVFNHLQAALGLPPVKPRLVYRSDGLFSCSRWAYGGNRRCLPIVNYLYEDAELFLDRKRQIVLDHYRAIPKYRDLLRFG